MSTLRNKWSVRKIISLVLILTFIIPPVIFPPKKAEAQWAVFDVPNLVANTGAAVSAASSALSNYSVVIKEYILDVLPLLIAKAIIRKLTASVVTWINNGFEGGGPGFVTNPGEFFTQIGDEVAGDMITDILGNRFLCSPFELEVSIALSLHFSSKKNEPNDCNLSDIVGNIEGFIDGVDADFNEGGWTGWFSLTQTRSNNPYGAYIDAATKIEAEINSRQGAKRFDLELGGGFLSWEKCEMVNVDEQGNETDEPVTDPGSVDPDSPPSGDGESPALQKEVCNTETPGSVINSQLEGVLGTDLRQLELADEINEIVGALAGQLIKQVVGGGGSLRQASRPRTAKDDIRCETDPKYCGSLAEQLGDPESDDEFNNARDGTDLPTVDGNANNNNTAGKNIALGREARQKGQHAGFVAENATDGSITGETMGDSFGAAITGDTDAQKFRPWWEVDLATTTELAKVVIYPRTKFQEIFPLKDFIVIVSERPIVGDAIPNPDSDRWISPVQPGEAPYNVATTVMLPEGTRGRYVRIQLTGINSRLELAEVRVWTPEAKTTTP